jgi:hypothetical protein
MSRGYVGLSVEELQALSNVSGEAVRLYWAVASFAYGDKVVAHPKWETISERIGKTLDPRNGRRLAKQLEEAGLVRRGKFGKEDRWRLVLKEQIILRRQGRYDAETGSNEPDNKGNSYPPTTGSNLPDINKTNKRREINNKLSNEINEDEDCNQVLFVWTDSKNTTWNLEDLSSQINATNGTFAMSSFTPRDRYSLLSEMKRLNAADPTGVNVPKSIRMAVAVLAIKLGK